MPDNDVRARRTRLRTSLSVRWRPGQRAHGRQKMRETNNVNTIGRDPNVEPWIINLSTTFSIMVQAREGALSVLSFDNEFCMRERQQDYKYVGYRK